MPKEIIIDIMNETAEIKVETKGYTGMKCLEESELFKKALGDQIDQVLLPIAYEKENKVVKRIYKPICG
jgi:hypothetical protein